MWFDTCICRSPWCLVGGGDDDDVDVLVVVFRERAKMTADVVDVANQPTSTVFVTFAVARRERIIHLAYQKGKCSMPQVHARDQSPQEVRDIRYTSLNLKNKCFVVTDSRPFSRTACTINGRTVGDTRYHTPLTDFPSSIRGNKAYIDHHIQFFIQVFSFTRMGPLKDRRYLHVLCSVDRNAYLFSNISGLLDGKTTT